MLAPLIYTPSNTLTKPSIDAIGAKDEGGGEIKRNKARSKTSKRPGFIAKPHPKDPRTDREKHRAAYE